MNDSTLNLTLTKKWFDLILSGEKKEEYREIKRHWIERIVSNELFGMRRYGVTKERAEQEAISLILEHKEYYSDKRMKKFDAVLFKNGYGENAPTARFECKGVRVGTGNPRWGAKDGDMYFVIEIGKEIGRTNC